MKNLTKIQINNLQRTTQNLGSLNLAELNLIQLEDSIENPTAQNVYIEIVGLLVECRTLEIPLLKGFVLRSHKNGNVIVLGINSFNTDCIFVDTERIGTTSTGYMGDMINYITAHHFICTPYLFSNDMDYLLNQSVFIRFDNVDYTNPKMEFLMNLQIYERERMIHSPDIPFKIIPNKYITLHSLIRDFKLGMGEVNFKNTINSVQRRHDNQFQNLKQLYTSNLPFTHSLKTHINDYFYDLVTSLNTFIDYCNPMNTIIQQNLYAKYRKVKEDEEKRQAQIKAATKSKITGQTTTTISSSTGAGIYKKYEHIWKDPSKF